MRRNLRVLRNVVMATTVSVGLLVGAAGVSASALATTGPGTLSVSPQVVVPSSTGNVLTFTYTEGPAATSKGAVALVVPTGWTAPQRKHSTDAGYVTASAGTLHVSKMGITVKRVSLCPYCTLTITYRDVTAPSTDGTSTFEATASLTGSKLAALGSSPTVTVSPATSAPTITSIVPGNGELTVVFAAPAENPPVFQYTATCGGEGGYGPVDPDGPSSVTVQGLTNGVTVPCTVFGTNANGNGPVSLPVDGTPEPQLPGPPTIGMISPGHDQLTLSFGGAAANGSPVVNYTVVCGSQQVTLDQTLDVTVTGLTDGTSYSCTVFATNGVGNGPPSAPVSGTPEVVVPAAPQVDSVVAGNGSLTVSYTAPSGYGATITGYTATCGAHAASVAGTVLSVTVSGLTNGTVAECTLSAADSAGSGPVSDWSGQPGPPGAPVISSVLDQSGQLTVVYAAVSSTSDPSGYTATCGKQSATVNGNTTWATVSGLKNGKSYQCSVYASNAAGKGASSSPVTGVPGPETSTPTSSAGGQFIAVDCPSSSVCVAVGDGGPTHGTGLIEVSTNGGATFTDEPVPTGTPTLNAVTCTSAADCLAVGESAILVTANGGKSWTAGYGGANLSTVSCITAEACVAGGWVGGSLIQGTSILTSDGGATWQQAKSVGLPTALITSACLPSACVGVGEGVARSTDDGASWQLSGVPGGWSSSPSSVACLPTTTTCVMVGTNIEGFFDPSAPAIAFASSDTGQTWVNISASFPAASASIRDLSCPTATTCYALGSPGLVGALTTDGGKTWAPIDGPAGVTPAVGGTADFGFGNLSCPSPSTCILVGYGATGPTAATTTNGAVSWTNASVG
jgi:hypothetical protein